MATNYKRKTPCTTARKALKYPATVEVWCACCGAWVLNVYSKPIRVNADR